ncbi:MAG: hypothetical protein DI535_07820 [Citrobacter freundii]|nr:MAG: hypothetical protein DI535_07820 [Citrobacter freundii]
MAATFTLSLVELIVLLVGAIILGMTILFFINSRKNLRIPKDPSKPDLARNEWKLKYFNDIEIKDREITALTNRVNIAEENADSFAIELDDLKKSYKALKATSSSSGDEEIYKEEINSLREEIKELQDQHASVHEVNQQRHAEKDELIASLQEKNDDLQDRLAVAVQASQAEQADQSAINLLQAQNDQLRAQLTEMSRETHSQAESAQQLIAELRNRIQELEQQPVAAPVSHEDHEEETARHDDYLSRLLEAKASLQQHNEKIAELLGNIEVIREKEELQQEMARTNEELSHQLEDARRQLENKDSEIHAARQKESLTKEMSSMLDHAYSDFNILQEKIRKLEAQLTSSRLQTLEFEDLKEAHQKVSADVERYRQKSQTLTAENLGLQQELSMVEDKLREANLQRQQLQKKVAYLEEINSDLHSVADANKKLEGQLKRIGELESMLNVVSEERDQLMQKQQSHHPPYA